MSDIIKQGALPNGFSAVDFFSLWKIQPSERGKVLVWDKKLKIHFPKTIYRKYCNYLTVPKFDPSIPKSYMYCSYAKKLPEVIHSYLEFAKTIDSRFNSIAVNWYRPEDFMELHTDCNAHFVEKDSPVLIFNINEINDKYESRQLMFEQEEEILSVPLPNNTFFLLKNQVRHGISRGTCKRISITFRMMKEEE